MRRISHKARKDCGKPLFAILILLSVAFFFEGFRLRGENESLKLNIANLERKIEYYGSTLLDYQKATESFIQRMSEEKK